MDETFKELLEGTIEFENEKMVALDDEDDHAKRAKSFVDICKIKVEEDKIKSTEALERERMEHERKLKEMELEHERNLKEKQMEEDRILKEKELENERDKSRMEGFVEVIKVAGGCACSYMGIKGTQYLCRDILAFEKTGIIRSTAMRILPKIRI